MNGPPIDRLPLVLEELAMRLVGRAKRPRVEIALDPETYDSVVRSIANHHNTQLIAAPTPGVGPSESRYAGMLIKKLV